MQLRPSPSSPCGWSWQMAWAICGWWMLARRDALRETRKWRLPNRRLHCEAEEEVQLRDEVAAMACVEPYEASRDAEEAHCCSQAGVDVVEARMHRVVVDPDKAADSAKMVMEDAGLDLDGRVACRSGRWEAYPSCREVEGRWGRVDPCRREGHDETWAAVKVDGDDACREVDDLDLRGEGRMVQVDSL